MAHTRTTSGASSSEMKNQGGGLPIKSLGKNDSVSRGPRDDTLGGKTYTPPGGSGKK